jgi:hypothetical protein
MTPVQATQRYHFELFQISVSLECESRLLRCDQSATFAATFTTGRSQMPHTHRILKYAMADNVIPDLVD